MQPELSTAPGPLAPVAGIVNAAVSPGKLGAVVARAGMGKTSFLVQTALYAMMTGKNVLHINLSDTVKKTALWYNEVFNLMTARCGRTDKGFSLPPLLARRLIMTMKIAGFSIDAVRERLMDFIEQGVFSPQMVVLDGVKFDGSARETVAAVKELGRELSFGVWLSVPAHREEARDERQRPAGFAAVADLFDVAWELLPEGDRILVRALAAGTSAPVDPGLYLNPSTQMLDVA
ncbi:MAG: cytoplasmic protein [Thermodesulfobacteriota bacterium]